MIFLETKKIRLNIFERLILLFYGSMMFKVEVEVPEHYNPTETKVLIEPSTGKNLLVTTYHKN